MKAGRGSGSILRTSARLKGPPRHRGEEHLGPEYDKALADEQVAQILGYLRSSGVEHGLLINFGAPKFEIKKYALSRIGEAKR